MKKQRSAKTMYLTLIFSMLMGCNPNSTGSRDRQSPDRQENDPTKVEDAGTENAMYSGARDEIYSEGEIVVGPDFEENNRLQIEQNINRETVDDSNRNRLGYQNIGTDGNHGIL